MKITSKTLSLLIAGMVLVLLFASSELLAQGASSQGAGGAISKGAGSSRAILVLNGSKPGSSVTWEVDDGKTAKIPNNVDNTRTITITNSEGDDVVISIKKAGEKKYTEVGTIKKGDHIQIQQGKGDKIRVKDANKGNGKGAKGSVTW